MNARLFLWALTAALAGFLFGFDTVVISGAEQRIQELWGLGDGVHGLAMSMALWGTVVGSLLGGWPADRFGRRRTLFWIGALYLVSALGSALAPDVVTFMVARFIGGLGVGASTVAAPLYITEIAPAGLRGRRTKRIPASTGSWSPLRVLHVTQAQTTFSQHEVPPREIGLTWSRLSSLCAKLRPQYWQRFRSR